MWLRDHAQVPGEAGRGLGDAAHKHNAALISALRRCAEMLEWFSAAETPMLVSSVSLKTEPACCRAREERGKASSVLSWGCTE